MDSCVSGQISEVCMRFSPGLALVSKSADGSNVIRADHVSNKASAAVSTQMYDTNAECAPYWAI